MSAGDRVTAYEVYNNTSVAFAPPKRVTVAEGVAESLIIRQLGGYSGNWSSKETPYMVAPMNKLASRVHEAVCFAGPARTGKTLALVDGWITHNIAHDPGDMLVVQMTQMKAREFSKVRVDRAIRNNPELVKLMAYGGHDDNTHDKLTKAGMWLRLGWPSASQLASSDYRFVALTDYDRMPDKIEGEGAPFTIALKRTQTYQSRGMCMVESSPSRDYIDPYWEPSTPHEAPPVAGILGIYNRSDRHRWYWDCPDCHRPFEASPGLSLFATLPEEDELIEQVRSLDLTSFAKKHAVIACPHCGSIIPHSHKYELNQGGIWVPDGLTYSLEKEEWQGEPMTSTIAGYWLGGVAAAYQSWESIVLRYLQGLREYVLTGSDFPLKSVVNIDCGTAYIPRAIREAAKDSSKNLSRDKGLKQYNVPDWARFLIASVDVQGGRRSGFVVQVHAVGKDLEQAIVDRYHLRDHPTLARRLDPAGYPEDWDLLTDRVVNGTYKLSDGRELRVLRTGIDTGGEAGVTTNAYKWFLRLVQTEVADRVYLLKGASYKQRDLVMSAMARDERGIRLPGVRLFTLDTDTFKDQVAASRRRRTPGPIYMHFPSWLPQHFYEELDAEIRDEKGKWKKIRHTIANESLDLWVYVLAVLHILGPGNSQLEFDWEDPEEDWALPLTAANSEIMTRDERKLLKKSFQSKEKPRKVQETASVFQPIPFGGGR